MEKERMSFEEASKLVLSGESVEVKPIVREKSFFKPGHDGAFMFTGTVKTYQLPFANSTRSYVKIFDNSQVQEAFEVLMSKEAGSFNIYDRNNKFWLTYKIEVTKEGKILDLSIPSHALEYLVLKASYKRIAPTWDARNRPGLEFALVGKSELQEDDNKRAQVFEEAMDMFTKIRKSNSQMYNILRLLDKLPPKTAIDKTEFLKTEILKIVETRTAVRNSKDKTVVDFINAVKDPRFNAKVLVFDAMDANEIQLIGGRFKLQATGAILGKSVDEAADWLEHLQNQEEKIILQQRLQKK
jgi:hypothetical protein